MKTETHSTKSESRRDSEVFQKRLLAELQIHQDRVDRARNELPVDSDPDDDAGVASRSAYREVTMGNLERDLQTIVEIERALRRLDGGQHAMSIAHPGRSPESDTLNCRAPTLLTEPMKQQQSIRSLTL